MEPDIAGVTNAPPGKKIKLALNCNDKLYHEIRDMNFTQIGPFLNRKAKEIDEYYKSRHGASVSQLRDFTKKLSATQQEHTSLRIRIYSSLGAGGGIKYERKENKCEKMRGRNEDEVVTHK